MLRKIGIVGLTVAVALVVFGCSNDAVTPEGQGTADGKTQNRIDGYCYVDEEPYEGVLVEASCGGTGWGSDYTDENGYYNIILGSGCPTYTWYLIKATPPDNYIPQQVLMYYTIGHNSGPDFYFP
jgi:hypothetical protein